MDPGHLIRHISKTRFKNHFFGIKQPYPQSGSLTIYDSIRPALRKRSLMLEKVFFKAPFKNGFLHKTLFPQSGSHTTID